MLRLNTLHITHKQVKKPLSFKLLLVYFSPNQHADFLPATGTHWPWQEPPPPSPPRLISQSQSRGRGWITLRAGSRLEEQAISWDVPFGRLPQSQQAMYPGEVSASRLRRLLACRWSRSRKTLGRSGGRYRALVWRPERGNHSPSRNAPLTMGTVATASE